MYIALGHHKAGRLQQAEMLYRKVLESDENNPDVLHMLGVVLYTQGSFVESLALVKKAIELSNWSLPGIRRNLGLVLGALLSGKDGVKAARLRVTYDAWQLERGSGKKAVRPLVSIVIPSYNHAQYIGDTLASVFRQSYRHIELIVIDDGSEDGSPELIRKALSDCPFPNKFIARDNLGAHVTINEGVRLSTGEYINVLNSDDCFEITRIAEMVNAVAGVGADWGFSAVSCMGADGAILPINADARVAWIIGVADEIRQSDTIGAAFLGENNVSVSTGNLFFSRTLFERLAGFSNCRYNHDWDFCLRALWLSEPFFVPLELYRYRLHGHNTILESNNKPRLEANRIIANYHLVAAAQKPDNPFAPSRHTLGLRYFSNFLSLGGGETFPANILLELINELGASDTPEQGNLLPNGLNIVGYFRGEFGLGVAVRTLAQACLANDVPVCLRDVGLELSSRQAERSMDAYLADEMRYQKTLVYMNPDMLETVWRKFGQQEFKNQYVIGFWYWELERIPEKWRYAFDLVDEIWVASDFVRASVAAATDKPVIKIPHSINVHLLRPYQRAEFGLPMERFLFLCTFDFNSFVSRKNPEAAIRSFQKAFPSAHEQVMLVVKCSNGHKHPEKFAALHQLIASDPRIMVLDALLERDAMYGLQSVCDAYISLHRSEGLGLGMAECMALEKPVIATAYSGNLEFMTQSNSCLVNYRLIPLLPGEYIDYEDGWFWADADTEHAAYYMRKIFEDSEFSAGIARQGKIDIETRFSDPVMIAAVRKRLAELEAASSQSPSLMAKKSKGQVIPSSMEATCSCGSGKRYEYCCGALAQNAILRGNPEGEGEASLAQPRGKRTFVVLGCPRGGTSLLAGALHHAGVYIGDFKANNRYEDPDFMTPPKLAHTASVKLLPVIRSRNERFEYWGWKDPNTIYYIQNVAHLLEQPVFLFIYRDPMEIAKSSAKHDGRSWEDQRQLLLDVAVTHTKKIQQFQGTLKAGFHVFHLEQIHADPEKFVDDFIRILEPLAVDREKLLGFVKPGGGYH